MSANHRRTTTDSERFTLRETEVDRLFERAFRQGGTLRDLLVALSTPPNSLIHGNTFRAVVERYGLRSAFDEAFQSPVILESLDTVWGGLQDDQATVEFRFAQPQRIKQQVAVGAINLQLQRTLHFLVSGTGDVRLQKGDLRVRWLFMSEDVQLSLRHLDTSHLDTSDESAQEVIEIVAGSIFHQTLPLEIFTLPPSLHAKVDVEEATEPASAVSPTDLPDEVAEDLVLPAVPESLPDAPITTGVVQPQVEVVHTVPGRVRFRIEKLYRNRGQKERLEHHLVIHMGVSRVVANPLTATLLVSYDRSLSLDELTATVQAILLGLTPQGAQQVEHEQEWHRSPSAAVVEQLESSVAMGLISTTVEGRRQRFGPNTLPTPQQRTEFEMFVEQFKNLPVALLTGSALLSVFTGGIADALVIMGVVVTNAGIGFYTERQAERTISAITSGFHLDALVYRDGTEQQIDGETLVPGDILLLKRGMYIPADARLIDVEHLTVDESALTGESIPVEKQITTLTEPDVPLGNRWNMVYRGTVVTGGSGRAVVVQTGPYTEVGTIQRMLTETTVPTTPLQRQLDVLGTQLVFGSMAVCGLVFGIGILRGQGILPMLKTAVALVVAAVPEGLPTVATTTLALGLRRLEKQQVLVRKLSGVETLGALQIICLDKTGTITRNRMILVALFVGMTSYEIHEDQFWQEEQSIDPAMIPDLQELMRLAVLCSEVEVDANGDELLLNGTPTETALVDAAVQSNLDVLELRHNFPSQRTRLRSEQRNFMDTLHAIPASAIGKGGQAGQLLAVKGRPADVLTLCDRYLYQGTVQPLTEESRAEIRIANERMAGRALRVLGVAYLPHDGLPEQDQNLIWVGLTGIADPPRAGIPALMSHFHQAGIDTTMITGDQSATANAIAHEIGLTEDGNLEILDSNRLDELDPDVLRALAQRVNVFSRVSPAHKLKIVQALQHAGFVVAMTGDGVNDGPALRAADIGIAMGKDGSVVAQEVADIVIRDDNLATIVIAVEQGRTIYADIKKAVHFILASNTSEILLTLTATTAGLGEPLNPMQLLWINLVTDIFPELALSMDPAEPDVMYRPPRDPQASMFSPEDLRRIGMEGSVITASTMAAYGWGISRYGLGMQASTIAFTSLTTAQLLHAFSCRSKKHRIWDNYPLPHNPYIPLAVGGGIALQALTTLVPGLRTILGTTRLGWQDWAVTATTAIAPLFVNEMSKAIQKR